MSGKKRRKRRTGRMKENGRLGTAAYLHRGQPIRRWLPTCTTSITCGGDGSIRVLHADNTIKAWCWFVPSRGRYRDLLSTVIAGSGCAWVSSGPASLSEASTILCQAIGGLNVGREVEAAWEARGIALARGGHGKPCRGATLAEWGISMSRATNSLIWGRHGHTDRLSSPSTVLPSTRIRGRV